MQRIGCLAGCCSRTLDGCTHGLRVVLLRIDRALRQFDLAVERDERCRPRASAS